MSALAESPLSVIIPVHNRQDLIQEAIDSVLEQSTSPAELIVVDDGSTDETPEVLRRYGERIVVLTQERRGRSAARNAGIAAARGSLIAFLDSDDSWHPDKLARQLNLLERTGPAFLTGYIRVVDEHGEEDAAATQLVKAHLDRASRRGFDLRSLVLRPAIYTSSWLVPKSLLADAGGFDEALHALEDWDLLLRLRTLAPMATVEWPAVVNYRVHIGNTASGSMTDASQTVVERHLESPALNNQAKAALMLVLARNLRTMMDQRGARIACQRAVSRDATLLRTQEWWRLALGALPPKSLISTLRSLR